LARLMDMGLEKLNALLLEMASISENSVETAISAYQKGEKGTGVREAATKLRTLHHQVSELSMEIIARYQPVASDLRFIKSCIEISYGFFRYGRYARDIVEVLEMFGDLSSCDHKAVIDTASKALEMMRMSIDAYARRDLELARKISQMDDIVDEAYRSHMKRVMSRSTDLRCALSSALILRYIERIADHAGYIGASVVYIVTGIEPPN
jgi:phosphate transport system protein